MKRLLAIFLFILAFALSTTPLAFAGANTDPNAKDTGNFNVFEILTTGDEVDTNGADGDQSCDIDCLKDELAKCGTDDECLTIQLLIEAEEAGTSPVGALILRAINILTLLIGTFAFVMIVIGGFIFATSGGEETQVDRGKAILTQSLAGLAVAFMSYFIVTFIQTFFYS